MVGCDVALLPDDVEWESWRRLKYALRVPAMESGCASFSDGVDAFVVAVGLVAIRFC